MRRWWSGLWLLACFGAAVAQPVDEEAAVRLLAVGDMNLGRHVGQMLLKGSIGFPFHNVREALLRYDIVFGNLESQITDQNGETQHPTDRYVFCAPPQAAKALKEAGFTALSTANNHALDYGTDALRETIAHLRGAEIAFGGTSEDSTGLFEAIILERRGIKFGFLAYTQFVNGRKSTGGMVSVFDPGRLKQEIGKLRPAVNFVIVSFHGGAEYKERPGETTLKQMRLILDEGADIVLGHHPHVPQGIERYKGKWILFSLGNFVFYQPQREWTQKSFAAEFSFRKKGEEPVLEAIRLLPLRASHQPSFGVREKDRKDLLNRLQRLSNVAVSRKDSVFIAYELSAD
ncbi:MAG: CapA family protein [Ignavibacteriales bacterium]|nr:CapA family protein [Ignavibacteriales bacterium]